MVLVVVFVVGAKRQTADYDGEDDDVAATLQVGIRAAPFGKGGKDSGGDDLVAEVAEVGVAFAEGGHVFRVAFGDLADDPLGGEVDVGGHHDVSELAVLEVCAAGPGVAAALDAGAEHLDALPGGGLEGGAA